MYYMSACEQIIANTVNCILKDNVFLIFFISSLLFLVFTTLMPDSRFLQINLMILKLLANSFLYQKEVHS